MNTPPKILRRMLLSLALLVVCLAIMVIYHLSAVKAPPTASAPTVLPTLHAMSEFVMTNSASQVFSSESLQDRVWIGNVFFTSCPTICPPMMEQLSRVFTHYKDDPDFHIASFTVDPEQDTPAALAAFAARYKADTNRWHFLTASSAVLSEIASRGLRVGAPDNPLHHSSHLVLFDRSGYARGYYEAFDSDAQSRLIDDIAALLAEAPHKE